MMIIDCHVHLYDTSFCQWTDIGLSQANLVERARQAGIDKIVVSALGIEQYTANPSSQEIRDANNRVLQLKKEFPENVYGFCYLNPHNINWSDELQRCADQGVIGIKLWIAAKACESIVFPIVEKAIERNLIILQHSFLRRNGNLKGESSPFDVAFLAAQYPSAKIILAHAGANLLGGMEAIRDLGNIYVDTSGGDAERGVVEKVCSLLGHERVLFGSDAPGRSFAVQLSKVQYADITEEQKKKIMGENFMRLVTNAGN